MYKLLITSSWTGSRLWELTKDTNKALIQINGKEIISYIIELYPQEVPIVITLGYHGPKVKDFVIKKYPERNIEFINVDLYEGPWSSLGYSMLQAKKTLNCPFIFHCNDTIVNRYETKVDTNWAGGHKVTDSSQYTTFKVSWDTIIQYHQVKWATDFDYAHIWVVGIFEYGKFWNTLEKLYTENPHNSSLNDVYVLYDMLQSGSKIDFIAFSDWLDTGNISSLEETKKNIWKLELS